MGWGVIEMSGTRLSHVAHGVIATKPASGLGVRLMILHRELTVIIAEPRPHSHRGRAGLCGARSAGRAEDRPCPRRGAAGGGAGRA